MLSRKTIALVIFTLSFSALLTFASYAKAENTATQTVGSTLDNFMTAFNGESNANARYLAFAKKADEEGYGKVASLFRAVSRAEQLHFERHAAIIKKLGGEAKATIETPVVKSTKENLESAIAGETYESTKMYPDFLAKAKTDKIANAVDDFEDAGRAEAVHSKLYTLAHANLDSWKAKTDFMVCPKCGNVLEKLPRSSCPICMESKTKFMPVS